MNNYKCPYDHDQPEFMLVWYEENFEKLLNERDELYWKTQEDEREINDLRDAVDEKKSQRDKAIEVATIIQGAYLRIGGTDAPFHKEPIIQQSFKDLAELKGMKYFGLEVS